MTEVKQTAPSPQATNFLESKETLQRCLNDLLERYLNLLDRYQRLQQGLTESFSSGYLSIAQANFSNANKIRYGQDYYDDRMQASARVSVDESQPFFSVSTPTGSKLPTRFGTNEGEKEQLLEDDETKILSETEETSFEARDPLYWFGILVPQTLRNAQGSFQLAVIRSIPELASTAKEMKETEIEIRRTRKKLRKAV